MVCFHQISLLKFVIISCVMVLSICPALLSPHILIAPIMFRDKYVHKKIIILFCQSHPELFWSMGVGTEILTVQFSNTKPSRLSDLIYVIIAVMYSDMPKLLLWSYTHTSDNKCNHKEINYRRLPLHGALYIYVDLTVTSSLTTCHRHIVYVLTQHVPRPKNCVHEEAV
jgi:hypothetical protein